MTSAERRLGTALHQSTAKESQHIIRSCASRKQMGEERRQGNDRGRHKHSPSSLHSFIITALTLLFVLLPLARQSNFHPPFPSLRPPPSSSPFVAMCKHAMCEHAGQKPAVPSFTRTVQTYALALTPLSLLLLMPLFGRAWVPLSVQLALLLVGIGFLVGRALSWQSFQLPLSTRQSLSQDPEHVEWAAQAKADRLEIAERLGAAIRLQTVSYDQPAEAKKDEQGAGPDDDAVAAAPATDYAPFLAMHALLEEKFPLVHANLQRTVINNYSLLFHWKAAAAPAASACRLPILLTAHLDVVPVPDAHLWDAEAGSPFSGMVLREEYVCGRGAIDDKHAVMGIMEALESLLRRGFAPTRDVFVAFGHDEEVSGHAGAASIANHLESLGLRFSFLLDEGLFVMDGMVPGVSAEVAMVCVAEKGFLVSEYKVSVPAHLAGHASTPARESAIGILARALAAMEDAPMPTYLTRGSPVRLMFESVASHAALPHKILFANLAVFSPLLKWVLALKNTSATLIRTTTALTVVHAGTKVSGTEQLSNPVCCRAGEINRVVYLRPLGLMAVCARLLLSNPGQCCPSRGQCTDQSSHSPRGQRGRRAALLGGCGERCARAHHGRGLDPAGACVEPHERGIPRHPIVAGARHAGGARRAGAHGRQHRHMALCQTVQRCLSILAHAHERHHHQPIPRRQRAHCHR